MSAELSIVIPAFNEAAQIGRSLSAIRAHCEDKYPRHEVIVVDDGSSDTTSQEVRQHAAQWSNLRLIRLERNQGKGAAIKAGVLAAELDWVLCSDADLSIPIEQVDRFIEAGQDADLVIASRALAGSQPPISSTIHRRAMSLGFNSLVRLLGISNHPDTQCGFKLYRRSVAQKLFSKVTIKGFAFDVEVLFWAQRLGLRVLELPVVWQDSKRTTVRLALDPLLMLIDLLKLRVRNLKP